MDRNRRDFLATAGKTIAATSVISGFPSIVPSSVLGAFSPSNRINVGAIGSGRISRGHDLPGIWRYDTARIMAACDLDSHRVEDARTLINEYYGKKTGKKYDGVTTYTNYQELLANKDVDAVVISTPDHWHAIIAIHAVQAGKDVYLQKPASLTIAEGRALSDAVHRSGRIFQIGSQQRSTPQFRYAAELVRNGRIGQLRTVQIGLPGDPAGEVEPTMPVPKNLNYDMWLGSTPVVPYTEKRVHPQVGYDRPGWLRCEQFGAGMITGWGAHHIDIAHWAMNTELSGPIEISATAEFPKKGLWDVHGPYHVRQKYQNGAAVYMSEKYPTGLRFIGESGWIWVTRGNPASREAIDASDRRILTEGIKDGELHLHKSPQNDHHLDWLTSIRTRQEPAAPAEVGHRSCTACLLAHASMRLGRTLKWDPVAERFVGDDEANKMLSRPQRAPYGTNKVA